MFPKDNKFVTHPISIIDQDPISGPFLLESQHEVSRHLMLPIQRREKTINELGIFLFRVSRDNQGNNG